MKSKSPFLSGLVLILAAIAKSFGVGYVRQPTRPDGGYAVDHSSQTVVIGPDGQVAELLPLGVATDKVVATVRKLP